MRRLRINIRHIGIAIAAAVGVLLAPVDAASAIQQASAVSTSLPGANASQAPPAEAGRPAQPGTTPFVTAPQPPQVAEPAAPPQTPDNPEPADPPQPPPSPQAPEADNPSPPRGSSEQRTDIQPSPPDGDGPAAAPPAEGDGGDSRVPEPDTGNAAASTSEADGQQRRPRTLEQLQADFGGAAPQQSPLDGRDEEGGAPAGASRSSGPGAGWLLNVIGALVLVVGLIYLLRWGMVKFSGRLGAVTQSPVLEVLARVAVAPRSNVLLIRMGHRILAVGETAAGMQTLAEFRDGDEMAALLQSVGNSHRSERGSGFTQVLGRFQRHFEPSRSSGGDGGPAGEPHRAAAEPETADPVPPAHDSEHLNRARRELSGLRNRLRTLGSEGIEA